MPITWTFLS